MSKDKLGKKRICPTTGKKFYDLNKDPIISPCLLYTSPSPRDMRRSRMPSSA